MRLSFFLGLISFYACETIEDGTDPKPEVEFKCQAADSTYMTVQFINNTVHAFSYYWTFGDGNTSTETSPTHTFQTNGSYDVKLSASGNGGNSALTKTIDIPLQ